MKKIFLMIAPIIFILIISVSYFHTLENSNNETISASIIITKNFGNYTIQQDDITIPKGTSALEALKKVAKVETNYGGGFVSSINNLRSNYPDKKFDWFYYVNGFLANKGAASYIINEGDLIRWDYHTWEFHHQSAILADYPRQIINGYEGRASPTIILYENDFLNDALSIKRQLNNKFGINATCMPINKLSIKEKSISNLIIIARSNNEFISDLNEINAKIGFFAFFDQENIIETDYSGTPYRHHTKAGMIQITQNVWNPKGTYACENIILLISGNDLELIHKSSQILIQELPQLKNCYGLIVTEEELHELPRSKT